MPILYPLSKSPAVAVTAQKIPTQMKIYLWNKEVTERQEGKTVYVGTTILVRTALFKPPWFTGLDRKRNIIFHKLNDGSFERIADVVPTINGIDKEYTLSKAGTHTFYAEFPGDDTYEGCSKAVRVFAR